MGSVGRSVDSDLVICAPPRHSKTVIGNVCLPAWLLGHNPWLKIICVSYSDKLSIKPAKKTHKIMTSDWYQDTRPKKATIRKPQSDLVFCA